MTKIKKCPQCGSKNLIYDELRGEIVCADCGTIIDEYLFDFSQDWREFDSSDAEKRRVGSPSTYTKADKGLGTQIGTASEIKRLPYEKQKKFRDMTKWQNRIQTPEERNVKLALMDIKRIASVLSLPRIIEEEASRLYRKAAEKGLVRGRSMESVVVGAVYTACRKYRHPITLEEIAKILKLDRKDAAKTYRFLTRELKLRMEPPNPEDYIYRFGNQLNVSQKTIEKAIEILRMAQKKEITSGKGPTGLAAAVLYIASLITGEKRTQREVADKAGVTEVTIRNRYKELLDKLDLGDLLKGKEKSI